MTRNIYFLGIDLVLRKQLIYQVTDKSYIIYIIIDRLITAAPCIPRSCFEKPGALYSVRINDDKPGSIRLCGEISACLELLCTTTSSMQSNHKRKICRLIIIRGKVYNIGSYSSIDCDAR